jgi:putative acetyltransferase
MAVEIARERPDAPDAAALVEELEAHLAARYPDESRHGFSVDRLVEQGVHFFVLREDGIAGGCGGVLLVPDGDDRYAEIKRMYTRPAHRGKGYGRRILVTLIDHARDEGYPLIRLETGVDQVEAIGLYESMGFRVCPPFGPYRVDPLSPCYELRLPADDGPGGNEERTGA